MGRERLQAFPSQLRICTTRDPTGARAGSSRAHRGALSDPPRFGSRATLARGYGLAVMNPGSRGNLRELRSRHVNTGSDTAVKAGNPDA